MKAMPLVCTVTSLLYLFASTNLFAAEVAIGYEYKLTPQVDFSKATKGPLKIAKFTDGRSLPDERTLAGDSLVDQPVADIVSDALVQAVTAGGGTLVEEGQKITLDGEVTEVLVTEKDGGIEVTIRTHVTLRRGSQTAFDTVIFGRSSGSTLEEAVRATLDRLVNSLILDDYFLMEVL
jgi:hypothetical protein